MRPPRPTYPLLCLRYHDLLEHQAQYQESQRALLYLPSSRRRIAAHHGGAGSGSAGGLMDTKWLRNSFVYLIILVAIIALFFTVFQPGSMDRDAGIGLNELA